MKETGDSEYVEYEEILETYNPSDRAILKSILEWFSLELLYG